MIKIMIIWFCCGLYGYWLDRIRTKTFGETSISLLRGVLGGLVTVVGVMVAMSATPANEKEDELY